MNIIKRLLLLIFVITFQKIYAYDYAWEVEYEIKCDSLEIINNSVMSLLCEKSYFQAFVLDWDAYNRYEPKGHELGIKNIYYKLCLEKKEYEPFGKVLQGDIYLQDVNSVVRFYIPYIKGRNRCYIRLVSYCNILERKSNIICGIPGKYISFNDVEPTKKEIPIKESFEKNFLSKLPLEWEYEKPAAIDRFFSKFLSLFRKRKNFVD